MRTRVGALAASALVITGTATLITAGAAQAATGGAGAPQPYVRVEADTALHNGAVVGPSYEYNTIMAEASGRKAVTLDATGEFVEFTVPAAANSMVIRLGIPDSATGAEYTAPLSLYIGGTRQADLTTTNKYSHLYGGYQFSNTPQGNHHWYFDEYQRLLPDLAAGTKVRVQKDAGSSASSYTIDFIEFEQVAAPRPQPAGSVSITSHGADPTGARDSNAAIRAAITAAGPGGTVWIPQGTFLSNGHTVVDNVTITGAGMWHSIVKGTDPGFYGKWRNEGGSSNVNMSHFQISGNVIERCDNCQVNGMGGALSNSNINNIWIEHTKVGMWMDGPMDKLVFDRMRVRDQTADGVNFHLGVTNSTVSNSHFRNTADDAMAMWSEQIANTNNVFDNNTVENTVWANGMAIYGGTGNSMTDNLVIDSGISQGGGMHVSNRFASTPLTGTTNVLRNTIIRSGGLDPNWQFGVGSLWFDARDGAMTSPVVVDDIVIRNSPLEAIHFVSGGGISNVHISNATIDGVGTFVIQSQVGGSNNTFSNVQATRVGQAQTPVYNCAQMTLTDSGGNGNLFTLPTYQQCGLWPTPVMWSDSTGLSMAPSALDFGSQGTGTTSTSRAVTLTNNGSGSAAVGAASITGNFAIASNTCGASLAAGASCAINVTFSPTAAGNRAGTLSVGSLTASLAGVGVSPGAILNTSPATLSFAATTVGSSTAAQTVTVTNSGTSSATVSAVSVTGDFTQTNNCGVIATGAACTVNATFRPTAEGSRTGAITIASNANNAPTTISLTGSGIGSNTNIAAGRTASASTSVNGAQAANTSNDGNTATYWESNNNAFPQWLQIDLGSVTSIGRVVLKLPPPAAWATRTQTLAVQGSADGTTFSTLVASAGYTFDPAAGNTVTINLPAGSTARYVRLNITGNTGWPAGQIAEFEIYPGGGGGGTAALAANPTSLAFGNQAINTTSAARSVTITNTGTIAATVSSVTVNGEFAQTNNCSSIAASASCTVNVTFRPTTAVAKTGTLTVNSNATNSPTNVALSGTGTTTGSATLSANPTSVAFGNQNVNTTSAASAVTITNTGTIAATVSSVTVNGEFAQTNNCSSIAASASCTVNVTFRPTTAVAKSGTLTVNSNASNPSLAVALTGTGVTAPTGNLALGKATSESSHADVYGSGNVTDGNTGSYWESANNAFPQWVQVDLGSVQAAGRVVLTLPSAWGTRTQTLSVLGATTSGGPFSTLSASAGRTFDPASANTVTITFAATSQRYIRINITGNTGWPAGQLSEVQVFSS